MLNKNTYNDSSCTHSILNIEQCIFAYMTRFEHDTVVPYKQSTLSKKKQVESMFDDIAYRYDFLNRFLSAGIDVLWRKKALKQLKSLSPKKLLDVATGTADVAIMANEILHPLEIIGIDISDGMLEIGRKKINKLELDKTISLINGDSEALPFSNESFDAVTVAFGVRNFQNLEAGLKEIQRVLKPGGKLVVLEFSKPNNIIVKGIYSFYMKIITPTFGKLFSKNKQAYAYLDASIQKFPEGKFFMEVLNRCDFKSIYQKKLSLGICSIYCGTK